MWSSRNNMLLRALAVLTVAALPLAGCNESSPTEPKALAATPIPTLTPTPLPPSGNIAGTWTGTYVSTDWLECDTSIVYSAQATLWQNGAQVGGTLTATGDPKGCPCGNVTFTGTLQGNRLDGTVGFPNQPWRVNGIVYGSSLDFSLVNPFGTAFGETHLHR